VLQVARPEISVLNILKNGTLAACLDLLALGSILLTTVHSRQYRGNSPLDPAFDMLQGG
jgi:hypothetical protein